MEKLELQQKSELVISPISKISGIDFKFIRVDKTFWFNRIDDSIEFYYFGKCKSHSIGITYYPNDDSKKYCIWFRKINSNGLSLKSKKYEETFDSELELCVFLKQSKFKIK